MSRGVLLFQQPGLKQEFLAVKFLLPDSRIFTDSEHDRVKYKFPFYSAAISRGRGSTGGRAARHKTRHTNSPRVWVSLNGESGFRLSPSRLDGVLIKRGRGNEIQIGFRLDSLESIGVGEETRAKTLSICQNPIGFDRHGVTLGETSVFIHLELALKGV